MAMAGAASAGRCLLLARPSPFRLRLLRAALSTAAPTLGPTSTPAPPPRHELLLEHLRLRRPKDASSPGVPRPASRATERSSQQGKGKRVEAVKSFEELGLGEEVMVALGEMGISKPRAAVAAQALLAPAPPPSTATAIAGVDPSSSISSHKPSCALPLLPSASQALPLQLSLSLSRQPAIIRHYTATASSSSSSNGLGWGRGRGRACWSSRDGDGTAHAVSMEEEVCRTPAMEEEAPAAGEGQQHAEQRHAGSRQRLVGSPASPQPPSPAAPAVAASGWREMRKRKMTCGARV